MENRSTATIRPPVIPEPVDEKNADTKVLEMMFGAPYASPCSEYYARFSIAAFVINAVVTEPMTFGPWIPKNHSSCMRNTITR